MRERGIIAVMARRLAAGMLVIWLLTMALATILLAGDLLRQGAAACAPALEQALADCASEQGRLGEWKASEILPELPEVHFTPTLEFPLLNLREINFWSASMTLSASRMIVRSQGLAIGSAAEAYSGFTVREGRLYLYLTESMLDNMGPERSRIDPFFYSYGSAELPRPFLTFRAFPLRRGSFPCAEISGDYPSEARYDPLKPADRGNAAPESLLDGIEGGELHFDSRRLIQGSLLRGVWLRDGEGNKRCFILGAYGWCPLFEAAYALGSVYLLSFVLYQLLGVLVWLSFRRSLAVPLGRRARAMLEDPLGVSREEYDYRTPFRELRSPIAAGLLRRQLLRADALLPAPEAREAEDCPLLLATLERCEDKLLPILVDRGQRITRVLRADGRVRASEEQVEDALLALFRETFAFTELNAEMVVRTLERGGFLLAEIEIRSKRGMKELEYERLWDGVYRSPADGDAPGAKLRMAMHRLPGSFAAVRKTGKGLALTLGLPKK